MFKWVWHSSSYKGHSHLLALEPYRPIAQQHWWQVLGPVPGQSVQLCSGLLLVGLTWPTVPLPPDPPACCWPPTACERPPHPGTGALVPFLSSHHSTSPSPPPSPQTRLGRRWAGPPARGSSPTEWKRDLWGGWWRPQVHWFERNWNTTISEPIIIKYFVKLTVLTGFIVVCELWQTGNTLMTAQQLHLFIAKFDARCRFFIIFFSDCKLTQ